MNAKLHARLLAMVLMLWCGWASGRAGNLSLDLSGLASSSRVTSHGVTVTIQGDYHYAGGTLTLQSGAAMVVSSATTCFDKIVLTGYTVPTGSGFYPHTYNGTFASGTWTAKAENENSTTLSVYSGSTVTLTGMSVSTTTAQPKTVPEVTLSGTYFTAKVNQYKFTSPTLVIKDPTTKADITNRFQVNYFVNGQGLADDGTTGKTDKDGKQITEDPATGTTITRLYGKVKIGDRSGQIKIAVAVAPIAQFASKYGVGNAYYTINISKIPATVNVSPRTDMGVAVGQTVKVPTFSMSYADAEGQQYTLVASPENAIISYTIEGGSHIAYDAGAKTIKGLSAGTATIHYTITPTAKYAKTFDAQQVDVTVKVENLSGRKVATHIEFPEKEQTIYRWVPGLQTQQKPKVVDAYGNDVTDNFMIAYYGGQSAEKTKYTYYNWLTGKDEYFYYYTEDYAKATNYYSGSPNFNINSYWGDIVMRASASPNPWNGAANVYEAAPEGSYILHVIKRTPKVVVTTDNGGETTSLTLPEGYAFNFTTTFHVKGVFTDVNTGEKTELHYNDNQDNKILYFIKIPAAWKELVANYPNKGNKEMYAEYTDDKGSWIVFQTTEAWGTDAWMMKAQREGTFSATLYTVAWNKVKWDVAASTPMNISFSKTIPATITATPAEQTVYVGDQPNKPVVKVINDALGDVTSHYKVAYSVSDPDGTGTKVDASTGTITKGTKPGKVTVTVIGTPAKPIEGFQSTSTTYVINVVNAADRFKYEIVKTVSPTDKDMGKMQITGAGSVPGGYSIQGVPGLKMQLGKNGETGWSAFTAGGRLVVADGPVGNKDVNGIPQNGTYFTLIPITNGFLTIDANLAANNKVVLVGVTDKGQYYTETYTPTATENGEYTFKYPLLAGGTYYLYNEGNGAENDGLKLHGLNFMPAFIYQRSNTEAISKVTIFMNGYVGTLPKLSDGEHRTVTYNITAAGHAVIDTKTGVVSPKSMGEETVTATVNSTTVAGVYRLPSYLVTVGAIPTYVVKDDELLSVGERLTTTNIPTRMFMTMGGWKDATGPYIKYTYEPDKVTIKSAEPLLDSWKTAKVDLIGKSLDNFIYQTQGGQNATDENVAPYATAADAKHTFANLPVRGAYLRFEPEENGTLLVYVLQNGACDYDKDEPEGATSSTLLKYRPLFIVDESGNNVELNNSWTTVGGLAEDTSNPNHSHKGRYSEGYYRCQMNDATIAQLTKNSGELAFKWDEKFSNETDRNTLLDTWRGKAEGTTEEIIRLQNGGYTMVSKAYVRYAINVKAGKSYYVFQNASKLGFCGFAFIPYNYHYDANNTTGIYTPNIETVSMSDKATSYVPQDKKNVNVALTGRSLKANTWAPICLPFSVSETKFKETFGDDAKIITFNSIDKSVPENMVINFDQHVYHMIVAGQPYFICPAKDINELKFDHVSIEGNITAPINGATSEGITFKGTFTPTKVSNGSYYLSKDGLLKHLANPAGATIKGFRAYMESDGSASAAKATMNWRDVDGTGNGSITVDNKTTGIDDISVPGTSAVVRGVYNLQGQRVGDDAQALDHLPQGVYIVDGRKVMVK